MLKKEKKRAQDAAAQLANITNGKGLACQSAPSLREGSKDTISADHGGQVIQYMKKGTLRCLIPFLHTAVYTLK